MENITLLDCKVNQIVKVKSILIDNEILKKRLMELGIIENTPLKIKQISHFNKLLLVELYNYLLTLDFKTASKIMVKNV